MLKIKNMNVQKKQIIILIIGFIIFTIGFVTQLLETKTLNGREMAVATVTKIEDKEYSIGNEKVNKTIYTIEYTAYVGTLVDVKYSRHKEAFENLEIGTKFPIYYRVDNVYDAIEYSTKSTYAIFIIITGVSIIAIDMFYMIKSNEKKNAKKIENKIKKAQDLDFKLTKEMTSELEKDIKNKQQNNMINNTKKENNKSILEQRLSNINQTNTTQTTNNNPIDIKNFGMGKELNTGSMLNNVNLPQYGNNPIYGSQASQNNYYGYNQQYQNPNQQNTHINQNQNNM